MRQAKCTIKALAMQQDLWQHLGCTDRLAAVSITVTNWARPGQADLVSGNSMLTDALLRAKAHGVGLLALNQLQQDAQGKQAHALRPRSRG